MEKKEIDYESVGKKIGEGISSEVYKYLDNKGHEVVLKYFRRRIKIWKNGEPTEIEFTEEMAKNKEEKLQLLDKDICMWYDPKLFDLIYDENLGLVGYTMEYVNLPSLYDLNGKFKSKKIVLLKKLKDRIEELNRNGVYVGDFMSKDNFLVDQNGEIKFLDVDNFHVHSLDFDLSNPYIDSYNDRNKKIDNVDNFCFNLFTLSFYTRVLMSNLYIYLKENGLPYRFCTEENKQLIEDMMNKRNYEKRYILDSQKNGLF